MYCLAMGVVDNKPLILPMFLMMTALNLVSGDLRKVLVRGVTIEPPLFGSEPKAPSKNGLVLMTDCKHLYEGDCEAMRGNVQGGPKSLWRCQLDLPGYCHQKEAWCLALWAYPKADLR